MVWDIWGLAFFMRHNALNSIPVLACITNPFLLMAE